MFRGFYKSTPFQVGITIVMISLGLISLITAFEIRTELDNLGFDDYYSLDSETKQNLQPKLFKFLIEFIFGIIMVPLGVKILISIIMNRQYRKLNYSRERKVARFQTQFGFGLLIIAILISFTIQSMNDNRYDWMYLWGTLTMIGFIWLVIYREMQIRKIFDSDHDILR